MISYDDLDIDELRVGAPRLSTPRPKRASLGQPRGPGGRFASKPSTRRGIVPAAKREIDTLAAKLPSELRDAATEAWQDREVAADIEAMISQDRLGSGMRGVLAGIGLSRAGRVRLDEAMDRYFEDGKLPAKADEVVVGGGLHAAIYCAVRVARGAKPPLVLEAGRTGGVFACSRGPAFYLNSRNRPGPLSVPGEREGLNVIPEGVIQPADLPGGEYQTNDDMAWVIRANLAMAGRVIEGARVQRVESREAADASYSVTLDDGRKVTAGRVVMIPGLGEPPPPFTVSERWLSYRQFMARMDDRFPLFGMRRVAVVGDGDAGRTVIEALCGQGPQRSVMALDYPDVVDWYGSFTSGRSGDIAKDWDTCNRPRYRPIGTLLRSGRVRTFEPVMQAYDGYETVIVNGRPYDYAVDCRGLTPNVPSVPEEWRSEFEEVLVGGRAIACRWVGRRVALAGPAANLELTDSEARRPSFVPESASAIFRYADRTALLASGDAWFAERTLKLGEDKRGRPIVAGAKVVSSAWGYGVVAGRSSRDTPGCFDVIRDDGAQGGGSYWTVNGGPPTRAWVTSDSSFEVVGTSGSRIVASPLVTLSTSSTNEPF